MTRTPKLIIRFAIWLVCLTALVFFTELEPLPLAVISGLCAVIIWYGIVRNIHAARKPGRA